MQIAHYSGLCNTPVNLFIMKAYVDLVEKGFANNTSGGNWQDEVIAAFVNKELAGVLTWEAVDWNKSIVVKLGYVDSNYRKQGVYKALWNELILKAKEKKAVLIEGGTHINNVEMQNVMKRLGRMQQAIGYQYFIDNEGI